MAEKAAPGRPIESPKNFPVAWDDPDDARLTWRPDAHVTAPLAPLSYSVAAAVLRGFMPALNRLGLPLQVRVANINGYLYAAFLSPAAPAPPEQKTAHRATRATPGPVAPPDMARQQRNRLDPILSRLDAYWHEDVLPENEQHLAYFESCDTRGQSSKQLYAHFAEGLKRAERMGELHALAAFPALAAMSIFTELHTELFPEATSIDALRLLQGFDNQTLAGDRALWRLSRLARAMPVVQEILRTETPEAVVTALRHADEGRRFLEEFQAYLDRHGRRLNHFAALSGPSWVEDPATAVACLQTYIDQPDSNPEAVQAQLAAEREQAVAAARRKLTAQPPAVVTHFESLLRAAQIGSRIKEDNHWILQRLFFQMRQLALVLGRRLYEAGRLPAAADVFYLSAEELLAETAIDESQLRKRRAAKARFSQVTPPPMLGTAPLSEPDDAGPLFRAMRKADAAGARRGDGDALMLRGQGASAGSVRGTARVITTLAQADRLRPGDVLVTKATTPPWSPLFAIAAAVVTDTGGVLSHCAVVAREYGIPAVVGTGKATQIFRDDQILQVDGSAGTVRVVSSL